MGLSTQSRRPVESRKRVRYYRLNTDDVCYLRAKVNGVPPSSTGGEGKETPPGAGT